MLLQKEKEIHENKIFVQRWTIVAILFIVLIIALVVLALYRSKLMKTRKERLELENHLNTYMQKEYRQQMNPHFIFNTLNSIQSFILKNDKESSSKYLSKFALLMRTVLENSNKDLITIEAELEAIKLYIELEKLRFEKLVIFNIDMDDNLLEYKLPPLIFQPFVENSIWHGFMHKEGDGLIQITIHAVGQNLVCEIIDNGIGRQASAKFKKKEHKSFGMSITQKRLELIRSLNQQEHKIVTEDLMNDKNVAEGTKVVINLPLIDL